MSALGCLLGVDGAAAACRAFLLRYLLPAAVAALLTDAAAAAAAAHGPACLPLHPIRAPSLTPPLQGATG